MILKDLFGLCILICDKHISKNLNACISYKEKRIPYTEIQNELQKVQSWCCPSINTSNLVKVVRCKDCKHRCKGKAPNDYCSDGEEV